MLWLTTGADVSSWDFWSNSLGVAGPEVATRARGAVSLTVRPKFLEAFHGDALKVDVVPR